MEAEFKNELQRLSVLISERKPHITNEEMTKQSLIIPFLQKLGYDVFNPLEVRPEYIADFGSRKGEKVDYAIFKNGNPIMFIEAKPVTENLDKHSTQLSRYFNATPEVKVAILTNGIQYKFFTDLNQENIMDSKPFLMFDMENLTSSDIEAIQQFTKQNFDTEKIRKYAEELVYMSNLNVTLKELFQNPSDDFIRFLIKDFSNTRITSNVIERFRPIIKKAISNTLLEIISEGLSSKELSQNEKTKPSGEEPSDETNALNQEEENNSPKRVIVTHEDEIRTFEIVKNILVKAERDVSQLNYKDTTAYFSIFDRVTTRWFLRIDLDATEKNIITRLDVYLASKLCPDFTVIQAPKGRGESRIIIQSIDDIKKLANLIVNSFDALNEPQETINNELN
ncbi:type I restriction endonuclease [Parageobacillus thermoglucosidasius]|uniref:type I restriction endonuclease n=1 Tax=Parageobacillus thermoglucosidasius TaxID=1426 RepID=UPI000B578B4F|nr:type I restriction endonuclease [Parageobacillus thermoglucosidasius]OUM93485.1 MAG: DNA polymerase III subunit epsilon [Parageobacillus thermoglucosidasius]